MLLRLLKLIVKFKITLKTLHEPGKCRKASVIKIDKKKKEYMWKLPFGNIKSQQKKLLSGWVSGQKYVLFNFIHVCSPSEVDKIFCIVGTAEEQGEWTAVVMRYL